MRVRSCTSPQQKRLEHIYVAAVFRETVKPVFKLRQLIKVV